jgi:hypothetical protein
MKTQPIIVMAVVAAAGLYMWNKRSPQAVAAASRNGFATNGRGTSVDDQGNWWQGGQMIYKAPNQLVWT